MKPILISRNTKVNFFLQKTFSIHDLAIFSDPCEANFRQPFFRKTCEKTRSKEGISHEMSDSCSVVSSGWNHVMQSEMESDKTVIEKRALQCARGPLIVAKFPSFHNPFDS